MEIPTNPVGTIYLCTCIIVHLFEFVLVSVGMCMTSLFKLTFTSNRVAVIITVQPQNIDVLYYPLLSTALSLLQKH